MKYSYKYKMALWSFSTVVYMSCHYSKKHQQVVKKKFETVWQSKAKDSIMQDLNKNLNSLSKRLENSNISPDLIKSLQQQCITLLDTSQIINTCIEEIKKICLKLSDQDLKDLVSKLEKSDNLFDTLQNAAPEPEKIEIDKVCEKLSREFQQNIVQFAKEKCPEILSLLLGWS